MIKSKKDKRGYTNKLTKSLDKLFLDKYKKEKDYYTYINEYPSNNSWLIKTPLNTRGILYVNNGVIKDILIFDDNLCYKESVYKEIQSFIGETIDLK